MRWLLRIAVAGVVVIGALAASVYGLYQFYQVSPPTVTYQKPRSLAEAQRDDLDYLRNLPRLDWSYTDETRAEANRVIDKALAQHFPLTSAAFELIVARVNAIADNGHTNDWGGALASRHNRLPVRFYAFADGVFVVRALPSVKDLLGAQLLAIDGHGVGDIRKTVSIYTGGTHDEKEARLPFYLESPELLHAAGVAQSPDRAMLTVRDADGHVRSEDVVALPANSGAPKLWPSDELSPVAIAGEDKNWIPALRGAADHLLLFAGAPNPFYAQALPGRHAFYVRFATNNDAGPYKIGDFSRKAFDEIVAARPDLVIVDLRMNGGGDYTTTAHFMRNLPGALPRATFYILLSKETFSAGMSSAAFLKQAAGTRGLFVGSLPGDRMRFHSEGSDFCLPYSHICMGIRTGVHDYTERLCTPLLTCYAVDWFYPVAIKSFAPDIAAPLTYTALRAGEDPALDAIFARETH